MKIYYNMPDRRGEFNNPVLTIGTFDGVHSGHIKILQTVVDLAKDSNVDPVVLTFDAHPRRVLTPATPPRILTTQKEKIKAISDCGINNIIMLKFTREIADMHAVEFLNNMIINKIGISHLVVGYDHAFGKNRDGDFDFLSQISKEKGFGITRVDPRNFHARPISSTWIRTELEDGDIAAANTLLGRRYTLFGSVVKGDGRGVRLGFPTANIIPEDPDKVIPKDGVYAVRVVVAKEKKEGMLNIGTNPTFSNTERSIEVNIFDFGKDVYGQILEIYFYERLRDEIKFDSPEALQEQLKKDREISREILRNDTGIIN
jgi:riboflavin kinase/FMN adenylyltransferase